MDDISIYWNTEVALDYEKLLSLLRTFGDQLPSRLAERANLEADASKLLAHADIAWVVADGDIVGFLAVYANDQITWRAHLPIISILPSHQGRGLGKSIMSRALILVRERGMRTIDLEVHSENKSAQGLYFSCGFQAGSKQGDKITIKYDFSDKEAALKLDDRE